jgi:hypothetical protein
MNNTHPTTTPSQGLTELTQAWAEAKSEELEAKNARLAIEEEIIGLQEVAANMTSKGTHNFGPLKIVTDFTRLWDQEKLRQAQQSIPETFWPFASEFKEIGKGTRFLEQQNPELWMHVAKALTLKPRKPSFSVKEAR